MACLLHIETSTAVCSVAVSRDLHTVWHAECFAGMVHAEQLPVYVTAAMDYIRGACLSLDAVAVSNGPGSFTGLRIGVSTAKGVCYGLSVPLIGLSTLDILCVPVVLSDIDDDALLCPMIDARRMEVYAQVCDRALRQVRGVQADIVTSETYKAFLDEHIVYFFGDGASKCKSIITHHNARFIEDIVPLASNMQPLADKRYKAHAFDDVAYLTPFYLKEFQTTTPRQLLRQQ